MSSETTAVTPKLYIAIDIHKRSWKVQSATDLSLGPHFTAPPDASHLKTWVSNHFPDYQVHLAYEAGCCGYEPARDFQSYGWNTIVFNPADISRTGTAAYQKTDRIDAKLICRELKDGRLNAIGIPDRQREELRALFRRRNALVRDFRRLKTPVKMQLLYLGITIPQDLDQPKWSHKFRHWIRSIECYYATGDTMIDSMMDQYDFLDMQLRKISNTLRAYCRKHYNKDYYLLRSIPGIGGITACSILAELGDLRRFKSNKQLAAYVRLIPNIYQTADNHKSYGVSPRAKHIVRSYLVEAAWQAIRADPALQNYYRKHTTQNNKSAIIKVARRLLNRARAVLQTETPYEIGIIA
jgi:transposase